MVPSKGDQSGLAILFSNLVTIVLAVALNWELGPVLAIYWCQSVIIGVFQYRRIIALKNFSTEGFSSYGAAVPENEEGKRETAEFFCIHFGGFHCFYLFFIIVFIATEQIWISLEDLVWIVVGVFSFYYSHRLSFRNSVNEDLKGRPNLGSLYSLPFARILPMHLTLLLGGFVAHSLGALVLFLLLKTLADYIMHRFDHAMIRKKESS